MKLQYFSLAALAASGAQAEKGSYLYPIADDAEILIPMGQQESHLVSYKGKNMFISPYGAIFNAHDCDLSQFNATDIETSLNENDNGFIGSIFQNEEGAPISFEVSKQKVKDYKGLANISKSAPGDKNRLNKAYQYNFVSEHVTFQVVIGISKELNVYYFNNVGPINSDSVSHVFSGSVNWDHDRARCIRRFSNWDQHAEFYDMKMGVECDEFWSRCESQPKIAESDSLTYCWKASWNKENYEYESNYFAKKQCAYGYADATEELRCSYDADWYIYEWDSSQKQCNECKEGHFGDSCEKMTQEYKQQMKDEEAAANKLAKEQDEAAKQAALDAERQAAMAAKAEAQAAAALAKQQQKEQDVAEKKAAKDAAAIEAAATKEAARQAKMEAKAQAAAAHQARKEAEKASKEQAKEEATIAKQVAKEAEAASKEAAKAESQAVKDAANAEKLRLKQEKEEEKANLAAQKATEKAEKDAAKAQQKEEKAQKAAEKAERETQKSAMHQCKLMFQEASSEWKVNVGAINQANKINSKVEAGKLDEDSRVEVPDAVAQPYLEDYCEGLM